MRRDAERLHDFPAQIDLRQARQSREFNHPMGRLIDQAGKSDADRRNRRRRGLFFRHLSGYRQDLIGQRAPGFPRLF